MVRLAVILTLSLTVINFNAHAGIGGIVGGGMSAGARGGPSDRTAQLACAISDDGLNWTKTSEPLIEPALFPCAVFDGERLRFYFSRNPSSRKSRIFVKMTKDGVKWEDKKVTVSGLPANTSAKEPSVVKLSDGRYRMYYREYLYSGENPVLSKGNFIIASAISGDGIDFKREDGIRFTFQKVTNPDVIQMGDIWRMFLDEDSRIVSAVSYDGGINFSFEKYIELDGHLTSTIKLPNGYRMYYQAHGNIGSRKIYSAFSSDGENWVKDEGVRIERKGSSTISMAIGILGLKYWMFYGTDYDNNDTQKKSIGKTLKYLFFP
ncbi:MAG: hypothetical protein PHP17_04915 [Candidatus Omnitrophica bacterium]|nr:hypothetical protein [Candidatus Omnitrophota bacterium]